MGTRGNVLIGVVVVVLLVALAFWAGQEYQEEQTVGDNIEEGMESIGDQVEDGLDEAGDNIEDALDESGS